MKKQIVEGLELKNVAPEKARIAISTHRGVVLPGNSFSLPLIQPIFSQHILFPPLTGARGICKRRFLYMKMAASSTS